MSKDKGHDSRRPVPKPLYGGVHKKTGPDWKEQIIRPGLAALATTLLLGGAAYGVSTTDWYKNLVSPKPVVATPMPTRDPNYGLAPTATVVPTRLVEPTRVPEPTAASIYLREYKGFKLDGYEVEPSATIEIKTVGMDKVLGVNGSPVAVLQGDGVQQDIRTKIEAEAQGVVTGWMLKNDLKFDSSLVLADRLVGGDDLTAVGVRVIQAPGAEVRGGVVREKMTELLKRVRPGHPLWIVMLKGAVVDGFVCPEGQYPEEVIGRLKALGRSMTEEEWIREYGRGGSDFRPVVLEELKRRGELWRLPILPPAPEMILADGDGKPDMLFVPIGAHGVAPTGIKFEYTSDGRVLMTQKVDSTGSGTIGPRFLGNELGNVKTLEGVVVLAKN